MRSRPLRGTVVVFVILFIVFALDNSATLSDQPARQLFVAVAGATGGALVYHLLVRWLTPGQ